MKYEMWCIDSEESLDYKVGEFDTQEDLTNECRRLNQEWSNAPYDYLYFYQKVYCD